MCLPRIGLERRHGCLRDNIWQSRRLEVLLAGLLLRVVLPRVLLDTLELVLLLPIVVCVRIEELRGLLPGI